jgi:hypothetical protein
MEKQDTARYETWLQAKGKEVTKPREETSLRIGDWGFFDHGIETLRGQKGVPVALLHRFDRVVRLVEAGAIECLPRRRKLAQTLPGGKSGTIVPMLWAELGDAKNRWQSKTACQRKPTAPLALSLSERGDGEPIARFRPLHRPSHPKQHRDFH